MQREQNLKILRLLIRPIARFCLRHSLSIHDIEEASKIELVELAADQMTKRKEKINASRLSVVTGVYRKEVDRIHVKKETAPPEPQSILSRVIGKWEQDKMFQTKSGTPRSLNCDGPASEFAQLVATITTALGPAAVLFDLERKGLVSRHKDTIKLIKGGDVVDQDIVAGFEIASKDIHTIISAVEGNFNKKDTVGHVHVRTEFDNLYESDIVKVQMWLHQQAKSLHRRARSFIAKFDKDLSPRKDPALIAGAHVALSTASNITHSTMDENSF